MLSSTADFLQCCRGLCLVFVGLLAYVYIYIYVYVCWLFCSVTLWLSFPFSLSFVVLFLHLRVVSFLCCDCWFGFCSYVGVLYSSCWCCYYVHSSLLVASVIIIMMCIMGLFTGLYYAHTLSIVLLVFVYLFACVSITQYFAVGFFVC